MRWRRSDYSAQCKFLPKSGILYAYLEASLILDGWHIISINQRSIQLDHYYSLKPIDLLTFAFLIFNSQCLISIFRIFKGTDCSDNDSLETIAYSEYYEEAGATYVSQCVNESLSFAQYIEGMSYPVAIVYQKSISNHNNIADLSNLGSCVSLSGAWGSWSGAESGPYSSKTTCDWTTSNPVLSLDFPDNIEPASISSDDQQYVIIDGYSDWTSCSSSTFVKSIGLILDVCYDDGNGRYTLNYYNSK